jgi:hypothetical protein
MRFVYDLYFLNLLVILIAFVVIVHILTIRSVKKRIVRFANYNLLKSVVGGPLISTNILTLVLRFFIVLFIFVSVANISIFYVSESDVSDYVILIDTSAMMAPNFDLVSEKMVKFVDLVPKQAKIGVVGFSGDSFIRSNLVYNRNEIKKSLINLTASVPAGSSIYKGLITASSVLDLSNKTKKIVLVTNGDFYDMVELDINDSISTLINKNITVYSVGIENDNTSAQWRLESLERLKSENSNDLDYVNQIDVAIDLIKNETTFLDVFTLEQISNNTNGFFYKVEESDDFLSVVLDIIEKDKSEVEFDLTSISILILSLLVIVEWALSATKYKTIP